MPERRAVDLALDLARTPSLAAVMREQTLPRDLLDLIRVAAGCPETVATAKIDLPSGAIKAAAILYLQETLFFPEAGPYRNLGVSKGASRAQMRLHMRWLLQWLHPDHNSDETAALLATRVIAAWRELGQMKRPQDSTESIVRYRPVFRQASPSGPRRHSPRRVRWIAVPLRSAPPARRRGRRVVILVLAAATAFALIFFPDSAMFGWLSLGGATNATLTSAATSGAGGATLVGSGRK